MFSKFFHSPSKTELFKKEFKRLFGKVCNFCGARWDGHAFVDICSATTVDASKQVIDQMIKDGKYKEVLKFNCADANEDIYIWRMFKCPSGKLWLATIYSYFEISVPDTVVSVIEVETEKKGALLNRFGSSFVEL